MHTLKMYLFSAWVPGAAGPWDIWVSKQPVLSCLTLDKLLTSGILSFLIYKMKIILICVCSTIK